MNKQHVQVQCNTATGFFGFYLSDTISSLIQRMFRLGSTNYYTRNCPGVGTFFVSLLFQMAICTQLTQAIHTSTSRNPKREPLKCRNKVLVLGTFCTLKLIGKQYLLLQCPLPFSFLVCYWKPLDGLFDLHTPFLKYIHILELPYT